MDYYERLQKAIDFIEGNLTEEINLAEIARRSGMSPYHFHRIFHLNIGVPVAEYVRRRRLSQAAIRLAREEKTVIDVALDFQYETHESFTRAFKHAFGVSPSLFREGGTKIRLFGQADIDKLRTSLARRKPGRIESKIVERKAFRVVGPEILTTTVDGENLSDIPAFWGRFLGSDGDCRIKNKLNPSVSYGIGIPLKDDPGFHYMIGFEVPGVQEAPRGFSGRTIPAGMYALFTARGRLSGLIEKMMKHIYTDWFPRSGRERTNGPGLEVYDTRRASGNSWEVDVLMPVK